jgi:hypothetical protein
MIISALPVINGERAPSVDGPTGEICGAEAEEDLSGIGIDGGRLAGIFPPGPVFVSSKHRIPSLDSLVIGLTILPGSEKQYFNRFPCDE